MRVSAADATAADEVEGRPSIAWVLASLALCMLLPALGTSIANVALPTLAAAFGASFQQAQWVVLAYLLATTALVVGAGRLGDIVGRKRLLLAGIVVFTVASAGCGAAPDLRLLIAARAAQGVGAAVMMALTMSFVAEAVPKPRAGSAMGLLGSMSAVGTALGPSLGGVLIAGVAWQAIFLVNVPLGVLAFVLVQRHLPADRLGPKADRPGIDTPGTLLLAATLVAYALAMTVGRGRFGPVNLALLLAAMLGLGLFVRTEARAASPLIRPASLRDPVLRASLATSALVATVMMATLVVGPFHLALALGLDAAQVGLVMSAGPAMAALAGVPAGRAVDRFGASRTSVVALAGVLFGCAALGLAPAALGIAGYLIPIVVTTAGYALFQAANNTAAMTGVAPDQRGVVSGMLNLARNLGLVTGASVMGAVFVATGMRVTFGVATALVAIALAIALAAAAAPARQGGAAFNAP